jgi:hypothetical protein
MMRSLDYARTAPEAREGFPVFVVVLTVVIMARDHIGGKDGVNSPKTGKLASMRLNRKSRLRDKLPHEPSEPF